MISFILIWLQVPLNHQIFMLPPPYLTVRILFFELTTSLLSHQTNALFLRTSQNFSISGFEHWSFPLLFFREATFMQCSLECLTSYFNTSGIETDENILGGDSCIVLNSAEECFLPKTVIT